MSRDNGQEEEGQLFPISVSFSRAVLLCNGSLFQQHQLIPACSFLTLPETSSTHPLRVTKQSTESPPGRLGSQVHRVPFHPFSHCSTVISVHSASMGPSSKCLSSHVFDLTLVSEVLCVVWLKPPCNPYGSFCLLVFSF